MFYNVNRANSQTFYQMLGEIGREVKNYYTGEEDKVLLEANNSMDGGKVYFEKTSWIKKGDIFSVGDEWFLVNNVSKIASDLFNIGVITRCDTFIPWKLGDYVYNVPCIASKYSGTQNTKGIIDDSVEGKLSFITGYHKELDYIRIQPYFAKYGSMFKVYNLLHNDDILNIYTEITQDKTIVEIGMSPLKGTYAVGDKAQITGYILKTNSTDHVITYKSSNDKIATIDKDGNIEFLKSGRVNFTIECDDLGIANTSPTIIITKI